MTRISSLCLRVMLLLAAFCASGPVSAGERTDIKGMGMARTFTASTLGLDAVGINPANLRVGQEGLLTFGLLPVGLHVGSDFMSYGLYQKYFTGVETDSGRVGRFLDDQAKREILDAFLDGLGTLSGDAEVRPIGLALHLGFGSLALTVTERLATSAAIPEEYAKFLLYGNTPGSAYDFGETRLTASWTREYALAFARPLPNFLTLEDVSGGIAVKLVHGYAYAELDRFNTSLVTSPVGTLQGAVGLHARSASADMLDGESSDGYDPFPAPAGAGVGFDLGVSGKLAGFLRVGLSITDIGSIRWVRNVKELVADTTLVVSDPLDPEQRDGVEEAVNGRSRPGEDFSTLLPTTLRLGVAAELQNLPLFDEWLPGELLVACDYNQGLVENAGATLHPRVSLGMEYRPVGFLPLRTGVSFGGTDHANVALGFGLHFGPFDLDLASENAGWIFATDSFSYGSAAVGMRLSF